jgi:hypothetical protein
MAPMKWATLELSVMVYAIWQETCGNGHDLFIVRVVEFFGEGIGWMLHHTVLSLFGIMTPKKAPTASAGFVCVVDFELLRENVHVSGEYNVDFPNEKKIKH